MSLRSLIPPLLFGRLAACVRDLCYPGVCWVCRGFCDHGGPLCNECAARLGGLSAEPACGRCGKPVQQAGAPCPWCSDKGMYPFARIVRLGEFSEPLRELIHQAKYNNKRWMVLENLADQLAGRGDVRELLGGCDCLTPVPLHWRRQFWRGYNQAQVLAGRLGWRCGVRVAQVLRRVRDTATQTQIRSHKDRQENVRGAFALKRWRASDVQGRHIILVDDVTTSGATLREAARTLLPARPASISAIVLAVADPKRRDFQAI